MAGRCKLRGYQAYDASNDAYAQVDQPLCYECARRVDDELKANIEEAKRECEAYEAAIARLAEEDLQPLTDEVLVSYGNGILCILSCLYIFVLCLVLQRTTCTPCVLLSLQSSSMKLACLAAVETLVDAVHYVTSIARDQHWDRGSFHQQRSLTLHLACTWPRHTA